MPLFSKQIQILSNRKPRRKYGDHPRSNTSEDNPRRGQDTHIEVSSTVDLSASSYQQSSRTVSKFVPPSSSPARTTPLPQSKISNTVRSASSDIQERLWNQAYDELKAEKNKWVEAYERVLSRELKGCGASTSGLLEYDNVIEQEDTAARRSQMEELIRVGLGKIEREDEVKKTIGEVLKVILNVKDMVGSAMQPFPHAALVWTGMLFGIQLLLNPTTETTANRDGVAYIAVRMNWYGELSRLLLKENTVDGGLSANLRYQLENLIVELYKTILLYLMKSVCSYYRDRILDFLRDMIKHDGWEGSVESIRQAEHALQQSAAEYNSLQIRSHLEELVHIARNQELKPYEANQTQATMLKEIRLQEKDEQCLWSLRLTDPSDDMKRIEESKDLLLEGSCEWVLKHPDFIDWRYGDKSRLFWLKGGPGKGKTMLIIGIVKELLSTCRSGVVSYFFCQGSDMNLNNATAVLRGLIYQILIQQPSLISHLRQKYDKAGARLFEGNNVFYTLSEILQNVLNDTNLALTYLIIDALDECETELPQLLRLISKSLSTPYTRVKWLVSSRNRPELDQFLTPDDSCWRCHLELNIQNSCDAIDMYIEHKVSQLMSVKNDKALQDQVRNRIKQKAEGTFLWASFVFKELQDVQRWDVLEVLEEVPAGLNPIYGRMMEQIRRLKRRNSEFCRLVLSTVVLSYRPLHLLELQVLAGLRDIVDVTDLKRIVNMCASFLTIQDDHVYLIHQSAKDYLTTEAEAEILPLGCAEGHCMMVSRSLQCMSNILQRDIYNLQEPGYSIEEVKRPDVDPLTPIQYACVTWVDHLCEVDTCLHHKVGLCDNGAIHEFLKKHFLHWLEALSLIRSTSNAVIMARNLENLLTNIPTNTTDLVSIAGDANRFILYHRSLIEQSPLQIYASALIFSPRESKIRNLYQVEMPSWIEPKPTVDEDWGSCLQSLEGHADTVMSVVFSPDGQQLVSASADGTIRLWDIEIGKEQQIFRGHTGSIYSVVFSPDGRQLASSSEDKTIRLWDETGAELRQLTGHLGTVSAVAFSPDCRQLASSSYDDTLRLWDAETGTELQTLNGHTWRVYSVVYSPDGQKLASGSSDCTIRLWDAETGAELRVLEGHTHTVWTVVFSPDGRKLASASHDHTIRLWDSETGAVLHKIEGHAVTVAFSPDGRRLVSGFGDNTIRLWDSETGEGLQKIRGHSAAVTSVVFSPDGRRLASASSDHTVRVWDAEASTEKQILRGQHAHRVFSMALSPDGQKLASASYDRSIRLWDTKTSTVLRTFKGHTDSVIFVAFAPDGWQLASASYDSTVRLWDIETGAELQALRHMREVSSVAFSPDNRLLASAGHDGTVRVWDSKTGSELLTFDHHSIWIFSVSFSPDGLWLAASGSENGNIQLWNVETGMEKQIRGHTKRVLSMAFSPDGKRLVSASQDKTIRIWDFGTGTELQNLKNDIFHSYLSFSSDGDHIITATRSIPLNQTSSLEGTVCSPSYCLGGNFSWIICNGKRVLWLPPEYRPYSSLVGNRNNLLIGRRVLAIGCCSGRVLIFQLQSDIFPIPCQ